MSWPVPEPLPLQLSRQLYSYTSGGRMAGPTATYDSFKMKGLRSRTFDESIYRWCTRSPVEPLTVPSSSIMSSSSTNKSHIPCLMKRNSTTLYLPSSSSSSSSSSASPCESSSPSDDEKLLHDSHQVNNEPLIPSSSFTIVNASSSNMATSHVSDSARSQVGNCNLLQRSFNLNINCNKSAQTPDEKVTPSSIASCPSYHKISSNLKRSTSFGQSACSSNCSKLTVSVSSTSFSNVSSRFSRRNLDYLDFSLDSLSVSSSSSSSNEENNAKADNEVPTMCKIKKEAAKLSESILLKAICELTSDSDISSYSTGTGCGNVSSSSLNRVKPPSIMERISSTTNSSSSIINNSKGTYLRRRSSKSCSPRKRNTNCNQGSPMHRKSSRNKRNKGRWFKSIGQPLVMSTSLDDTSGSLLLEMTGPPSLMDQVSGCWSENKASHGSFEGNIGNNLATTGSSSANSLNSVSSDIFDLPTSDPAVNQAASDLIQGLELLTKNHDSQQELAFDSAKEQPCDACVLDTSQIELHIESDDEDDVKTGATYDIKVEKPKLEDVIEEDSLALASLAAKEIQMSLDDACNSSATFILDTLRNVPFSPLTNENEPSKLSKLTSLSDLETLKLNHECNLEDNLSDKSDSDNCRSDFGVDDIPTDNTLTLVANESTTHVNATGSGLRENEAINDSLYIGATDTSEDADVVFPSDEIDYSKLSPSDYERFLRAEKAKLLAHTFAEMNVCAKTFANPSLNDSQYDAPLDLSSLSLGLLGDVDDDDDDEDTRATYLVREKSKGPSVKSVKTPNSSIPDDSTYPIESPSCKGLSSSESNYFTCVSDTQTYSIDDSSEYKTAASASSASGQAASNGPTTATPRTLVMNNGVRIRETRASALRAQKARSLGDKGKVFILPPQALPRSKTQYTLSNQTTTSATATSTAANKSSGNNRNSTSNMTVSSGYRSTKLSCSMSANAILNEHSSSASKVDNKITSRTSTPEQKKSSIPTSRSMSSFNNGYRSSMINSRIVSFMRTRIK